MENILHNLTFGRAIVIGIVLAAIYYFAMYNDGVSLEKQISTSRQDISKNKQEITNIEKAIQDADRYQKVMAELGEEMGRVLKAVPSQLTSLDLMRTIPNEAKSVGVQINSVSPAQAFRAGTNPLEDKTVVEPIAVNIELTGTYNQTMQFMSNLTRLDKIVSIRQLTLTSRTDTGPRKTNVPLVNFKAELDAYRFVTAEKDKDKKPGGG